MPDIRTSDTRDKHADSRLGKTEPDTPGRGVEHSSVPECQRVMPQQADTRSKSEQVRQMFDTIAPTYDTLNRLMTLGIDKWWRRRLVKRLEKAHPKRILDIATGTGDLAIMMARHLKAESIVGIDLSEEMIRVGRRKIAAEDLSEVITLEQGDSLRLPFATDSFDAITVAYGVRNFEDLLRGFQEMQRVLRPGGVVGVLELSTPTGMLTKPLYDIYTNSVIPAVGRIISHDANAYTYLPRSIAAVPQGTQMLTIMEAAGFRKSAYHPMTFGVCTLYLGVK